MRKRKPAKSAAKKPTSGGKASRQKGDRFEREVVNFLLEHGIAAERVPLSGSAGGSFSDDIRVDLRGAPLSFECKMRKRAWSDLYKWLEGVNGLAIRCNNREALVVMKLSDFATLHGEKW